MCGFVWSPFWPFFFLFLFIYLFLSLFEFFVISLFFFRFFVATLALCSRPRQRVVRLWAKRRTRESHDMFPGVQRVWRNEPSHSQVNSHVRSWTPKWTPKISEQDCRDQNPLPWRVFYIIRKLLKRTCLKWAHIAHLDIWNTSYGQKKGQESNWQFDSWTIKVENRPDLGLGFKP
jgi:hypothetical protein